MAHSFQPGDKVIWAKGVGGFHWPVSATVVAVTPRRVTIQAYDPDEKGEGLVTRHVKPESLLPQETGSPKGRGKRGGPQKVAPPPNSFEGLYPHIASWVQDGWIEVGLTDYARSVVRALDTGGLVWEGEGPYATLDEAFRALDAGIAAWLEEMS
jgi:hypothetical protein